jgi:type IV secretion system protein VirB10
MLFRRLISITLFAQAAVWAQDAPTIEQTAPAKPDFTVDSGVKIPLSLINSVSTKHSLEGDRVYLETAFPILANGRIVIPVGSYVAGTVTQIRKPGRVKGRGEIYVRFDTLTLPNGVTRNFRSRMGTMDASSTGKLDRSEGKVESEGDKLGDARTVAETTAAGASVGSIVGIASKSAGMGLGVGAGAGAAAGLIAILAMRGPDAVLAKGSTVEMILDRPLNFNEGELNFGNYQAPRMANPVVQPEQAKSQLPPFRK